MALVFPDDGKGVNVGKMTHELRSADLSDEKVLREKDFSRKFSFVCSIEPRSRSGTLCATSQLDTPVQVAMACSISLLKKGAAKSWSLVSGHYEM